MPDIGSTPQFGFGTGPASIVGTQLSATFNSALKQGLQGFTGNVLYIDAFSVFRDAVANPTRFGITTIGTVACLTLEFRAMHSRTQQFAECRGDFTLRLWRPATTAAPISAVLWRQRSFATIWTTSAATYTSNSAVAASPASRPKNGRHIQVRAAAYDAPLAGWSRTARSLRLRSRQLDGYTEDGPAATQLKFGLNAVAIDRDPSACRRT